MGTQHHLVLAVTQVLAATCRTSSYTAKFQGASKLMTDHVKHFMEDLHASKVGTLVSTKLQESRAHYTHVAADANGSVADHLKMARDAEPQWFLAGATTTCILRAQAIPGRVFHDFDATKHASPWDVMQRAGLNAIRVQTWMKPDCEAGTVFDNSGNVLQREMDFKLDFGHVDTQVRAAQLAQARNMKIIHQVNLGAAIPDAWLGYSYVQMLAAIDAEMRRQVAPFLQAGIQPDIVLLENEGSAGFLYEIKLPNGDTYSRGVAKGDGTSNATVSLSQLEHEVSGQQPTGHVFVYPQLAGYMKQQMLSIRAAIRQAGFDETRTRFGIHSHVQYVDWKQGITFSEDVNNELTASVHHKTYSFENMIPDYILSRRASDMLEIMGFSSYPEPMTPKDPSSVASMQESLARNRLTLALMDKVVQRYGKHTSGPFEGQYKKQALAVEYGSAFDYPEHVQHQQKHTQMYFELLKSYPWMLGALWYEPTYCYSNWAGGKASLYYRWTEDDKSHEAPTANMTTWGSYSHSPLTATGTHVHDASNRTHTLTYTMAKMGLH